MMPSTTRLHDGLATPVFPEAYRVFDPTGAVHPTTRVCDPDANGRDGTIGGLLDWGEGSPRGLVLGWDEGDPRARRALEPQILLQTTAPGEGIAFASRQACRMGLPCIGRTQAANLTGLIDAQEGFDRRAFLLAAVVVLRLLGSSGAVERSRCPIRPNRRARGTPGVRWAARRTAQA
jgi:hypothetical protein